MNPRRAFLLLVVVLALVPLVPGVPIFWITLLGNVGLAALVAMGLVLLTGVGGMTSFGQAAFCGFGAYATAVLTTAWGWSPWAALPVSLAVSGGAAVVLGLITVRLSGHFLPLGTMAWGLALYYLFGKLDLLGRHDGLSGIPPLEIAGHALTDPRAVHYVIWIAVIAAGVLTTHLLDSRIGRAIRALRKGQIAAEAFGIDAARTKLIVFVWAALLAGLSGWLYAHVQRTVTPAPFGLNAGIEYLFMAVVGGSGQIWGAIVGAGLVTLMKEALQRIVPALFGNAMQLEGVVFGIVLVALLQVAREGLWPHLARFVPGRPRTAPAEAAPLGGVHVVTPGQTINSIARLYNVSPTQLAAANDMASGKPLEVGQKLKIPGHTEGGAVATLPEPARREEQAKGDGSADPKVAGAPSAATSPETTASISPNAAADAAKEMAGAAEAPQATAYAPTQPDYASTSPFEALLKDADPDNGRFIPPLGKGDHSWMQTPLPASVFSKAEQTCLANAIYFEARSESLRGQAAVAQVVLNRVRNPAYPNSICGVVYQNDNWLNACQFSFACDGKKKRITEPARYKTAKDIAMAVTAGKIFLPEVGSSTHYYASYVNPGWARSMHKMVKIGLHIFYRTYGGGWS